VKATETPTNPDVFRGLMMEKKIRSLEIVITREKRVVNGETLPYSIYNKKGINNLS
jgi:hypothetical protein